jgi:hypothetical protein
MNPLNASWLLGSQHRSSGVGSRMGDASGADAPATQTTPPETTGSLQNILKAEFELLATYLANA